MPEARSPSAKSITLGKSHPPMSFLSQTTGVIHNRKNKAAVCGDLGPGLLRSLNGPRQDWATLTQAMG